MSGRTLSVQELDQKLGDLLERFPVERRRLVEEAGETMYQKVLRNINTDTVPHKGNLRRGVVKVIGSGGGYAAVRPNASIAPHTHLVENGHNLVRNGATIGWVNGRFMYRRALESSESELRQGAAEMAERLVHDCFD